MRKLFVDHATFQWPEGFAESVRPASAGGDNLFYEAFQRMKSLTLDAGQTQEAASYRQLDTCHYHEHDTKSPYYKTLTYLRYP